MCCHKSDIIPTKCLSELGRASERTGDMSPLRKSYLDQTGREWFRGRNRRPRKVRQVRDLAMVGVSLVNGAYVARPEDDELRAALSGTGPRFVVLHGPPGAGKRRMAYEAARDELPDYLLLHPVDATHLPRYVNIAKVRPRCLLWLDQLEFEGQDDVADLLTNLLADPDRDVVVLTIIETAEYVRFVPAPSVVDPLRPIRLRGAQLLETAVAIKVAQRWWDGEDHGRSPRWLPQRYRAWRETCPAAAAIVDACADWRRMGFRTIPKRLLEVLYLEYLPQPGLTVTPAAFRRAMQLVKSMEFGVPAIGRAPNGGYQVHSAFAEMRSRIPIPDHTWRAGIATASGQDAFKIGMVARSMGRLDHAEVAFGKAAADEAWNPRYLRALVTGEAGRPRRAVQLLDALLVLGPDLTRRTSIELVRARFLADSGGVAKAIHVLRVHLGVCQPGTREQLAVRHELQRLRCEAGHFDDALVELDDLAREFAATFDDDAAMFLAIRHTIAVWTSRQHGGVTPALELFERLIAECDAEYGPAHLASLSVRADLARLRGYDGDPTGAAEELGRLTRIANEQFGWANVNTLRTGASWAWWLERSGDPGRATTTFRRIVGECEAALGPTHRLTLAARRDLAICLASEPGHLNTSIEMLEDVLRTQRTVMDDDHPQTLKTMRDLAGLRARVEPELACDQLRDVLARQERVLDPDAPATRDTREQLALCTGSGSVNVALEPIYLRDGNVAGYAALFRQAPGGGVPHRRDVSAASVVIVNTFTVFDLNRLVGGLDLFLSVTREFVVGELPLLVPSERVVLEISDDVVFDEEIALGVERLTEKGYRVAISANGWSDAHTALLPAVAYVEIDVRGIDRAKARKISKECWNQSRPPVLIAARVETADEYEFAAGRLGCQLFHGRAMTRPYLLSRRALPTSPRLNAGLLKTLVDFDFVHVKDVINDVKADPALSSAIVKWCNSAAAGRAHPVSSVEEAVVAVGLRGVRDLAILRSLAGMTEHNEGSMISMLAWCRTCEAIAKRIGTSPSKAFLAGLVVEIANFLESPVREIAEEYNLTDELKRAIIDREGTLGVVIAVMESYQHGELEADPRVPNHRLRNMYLEAFADSVTLATAAH